MIPAVPDATLLDSLRIDACERLRALQVDIEVKRACGRGLSAADALEQDSLLKLIAQCDEALRDTGAEQGASSLPSHDGKARLQRQR